MPSQSENPLRQVKPHWRLPSDPMQAGTAFEPPGTTQATPQPPQLEMLFVCVSQPSPRLPLQSAKSGSQVIVQLPTPPLTVQAPVPWPPGGTVQKRPH
jgi:hypothetical protein